MSSVGLDLVEDAGRVAVPEVPGPTAHEGVDLSHDHIDRYQQPRPVRKFPDSVTGVLGRLTGWPTGEEEHALGPGATASAHEPMVKAQEIKAVTVFGQVHDPGLGRLRFQTEVGQQYRVSRASAASAWARVEHITTRSSA